MDNVEWLLAPKPGALQLSITTMLWGAVGGVILVALCWLIYVPFHWNQDQSQALKVDKRTGNRKSFKRRCNPDVAGTRVKYPPPFPNGWYGITHSSDIKREQVKSFDFLGTRVAVFRNDVGVANVLDAFCPHLGADIGIGGIVRGDCVECPFHHWSFRGSDGKCSNIEYSKSDQIPKNAKLNKWISKEVNGYIFAWYHAEQEEPWELPTDDRIGQEMVYHGGNVLYVNSHIQDIPENGADAAHLMAVHGDTVLAGPSCGQRSWLWNLCGSHGWEGNWRQKTEESQKHVALSELKQYLRFFNKYRLFEVDIVAEQIGPAYVRLNLSSNLLGDFVILQTVTPLAPLLQRVVHRVYSRREMFLPSKILVIAETIMIKRDIEMWNNKQYMDNPCLVKEDKFIRSFRAWFKQFYSANSLTYKEASEGLDW